MSRFLRHGATCAVVAIATAISAQAEIVRVATFSTELSRNGPGLLLRDILKGEDPQVDAVLNVIATVNPDVILLTDFDFDHSLAALSAFSTRLSELGSHLPHHFSLRPNSGMATGLDLDGNGRTGEARDAQGYGRFAGDGGMAIISRFPIEGNDAVDLSSLLWRDAPEARLPRDGGTVFPSQEAVEVQRLSSVGHWIVPVLIAKDWPLNLLVFSATPPVFDGPEDRNGLRNADEVRLWHNLLDGLLDAPPPERFVIIGNANLDPVDGEGRHGAMLNLLDDPRVQDPSPASDGGAESASAGHNGNPATDTADWREPEEGGPGNLRVDYVLPSSNLKVVDAGVFWPSADEGAELAAAASRHRLVWIDIDIGS